MPIPPNENHTINRLSTRPLIRNKPTNKQEDALRDFPGCAVIISHDRWFLDRVTTHTLAFEGEGGASSVRMFPGNYSEYTAYRRAERAGAAK